MIFLCCQESASQVSFLLTLAGSFPSLRMHTIQAAPSPQPGVSLKSTTHDRLGTHACDKNFARAAVSLIKDFRQSSTPEMIALWYANSAHTAEQFKAAAFFVD